MSRKTVKMFIISLGTITLRAIALVFMFVARARFPVKHSIVNVLRKRCGKILIKNIRKFERYYLKYTKATLDLDFSLIIKRDKHHTKFFKVPFKLNKEFNSHKYFGCFT